MRVRAGTSGYSYPEWKGPFYPEELGSDELLAFYARRLPAVEINSTFYRMPKRSVMARWAAGVPEDFRFSIKASRRITHGSRLRDAGELSGFLHRSLDELGDKLGCVLLQLPRSASKDVEALTGFLALQPPDRRLAFEFRHPSWWDEECAEILAAHGATFCCSDGEEAGDALPPAAGDWGYLRLRRPGYDDDALREWLQRMRDSGWREAFVFFKHEEAGAAPVLAERLLALACEE